MVRLFIPDATGNRPAHGGDARYATDPNWKDLCLFYEYFDGDTGRGCGASHQTGWTALVARLLSGFQPGGASGADRTTASEFERDALLNEPLRQGSDAPRPQSKSFS